MARAEAVAVGRVRRPTRSQQPRGGAAPPYRRRLSEEQEVSVERHQQADASERDAGDEQVALAGQDRHREQDERQGDELPAQLVAEGAARGLDGGALLHVLLRLEVLHAEEDALGLGVEVADALLVAGQLEDVEARLGVVALEAARREVEA